MSILEVNDVMGSEPKKPLYVNKVIKCSDCGNEFTWTVGEQEFYTQKNFVPPKRCSKCRQIKKQRQEQK